MPPAQDLPQSQTRDMRIRMRRWALTAKQAWRSGPLARELQSNAALSADELAHVNWQRRIALVRHCQHNVPFYQDLFRRIGFHPNDLVDESVFTQLPILEKEDVREHLDQMVAKNVSAIYRRPSATGGSTGRPLKVYLDARFPTHAMATRMLHWWGVDPSDNSGYLYRAVPEGLKRAAYAFLLYPTRRTYLHSANMTCDKMLRFYEALIRMKARYLVGYVGAVDAFGEFLSARNLRIPTLNAIWTTAAPLPKFKQQLLDTVYGCPVYTQYGCVEVPFLAAECRCRIGLHVFSDIRHLEVIGTEDTAGRPNAGGDIVVTDLTNYVCPMLRYRLGDRGRILIHSCKCGLSLPMIDYVQGRTSDNIYLPDGSSIPGEYWTTIFDDWPNAIKAFQVHQHSDYTVEIRFEPVAAGWETAVRDVARLLDIRTHRQLSITFRRASVNTNDNGKTRYVISEVAMQRTQKPRHDAS